MIAGTFPISSTIPEGPHALFDSILSPLNSVLFAVFSLFGFVARNLHPFGLFVRHVHEPTTANTYQCHRASFEHRQLTSYRNLA